ncbi:hypothetical protein D3C77_778030 [compost metagenome]
MEFAIRLIGWNKVCNIAQDKDFARRCIEDGFRSGARIATRDDQSLRRLAFFRECPITRCFLREVLAHKGTITGE